MKWGDAIFAVENSQYPIGNCSACVFRNWPKLCEKMTCKFNDASSEFGQRSIYWESKIPGVSTGSLWTEIDKDFFMKDKSALEMECLNKFNERVRLN